MSLVIGILRRSDILQLCHGEELKLLCVCAAQNGHASGSILQGGPQSHAAPGQSRFATEAAAPQQPRFEAGVTPVRLPPFPGPTARPQEPPVHGLPQVRQQRGGDAAVS